MQLRTFLGAVVLALSLTSCSTVQKVVYRIDVPQGNYLEAATVAQVKPGMTAQQVQYLLGTPVLIDPYSKSASHFNVLILNNMVLLALVTSVTCTSPRVKRQTNQLSTLPKRNLPCSAR